MALKKKPAKKPRKPGKKKPEMMLPTDPPKFPGRGGSRKRKKK